MICTYCEDDFPLDDMIGDRCMDCAHECVSCGFLTENEDDLDAFERCGSCDSWCVDCGAAIDDDDQALCDRCQQWRDDDLA